MKNKFLALAAVGAAAFGGVVLSAPANAQIPQGSGPSQNVTVNVSVPEILFLRTIVDYDIALDPTDYSGVVAGIGGSPNPPYIGSDQSEDVGGTVNPVSPFAGLVAGTPVTKTIPSAYIVWSNSPTNQYQVAVTPTGFGGGLTVAVNGANPVTLPAEGLVNATPQNVVLDISNFNAPAGTYSGTLAIEAFRP